MAFTIADITELREKTGVGMMDCKKALTESNGNIDKAIEYLRKAGIAKAAKKESRIASNGVVDSYIHGDGKVGVLLEVNCETDFVARSDDFKALVHDVALQIAAAKPEVIAPSDIDPAKLEAERAIAAAQAVGKPAQVVEKMVEGRIKKYYKEVCLLEQEFIKDPSKNITALLTEAVGKIGEKISIRRFVRFEMGEGLEKRKDNLAEEVAAQVSAMKK